ncbi:cytochrome C oxidase subunit IV family protein [Fodinisporobacter ferrooxydans]|uniref:Cytochrome C oxidase subunit IV family protein n=1 Tax=Fodinisporobacter ferrooxydans TaxID=2901836 RepID=A0ABY4CTT0_9BACL|nr:cytochrome C oxidase subunit IV family protein [Alicyclobacillaceae bacterium MYW30-H2]
MAGGQQHTANSDHENHGDHGSPKLYIIGYILSIVLTIIPLVLVLNHVMSGVPLVATITIMAILQFLIQLFFFMHITEGEKPAYHVMTLALGVIMVFTIVAGSAWIMTFNASVS